MPALSGEITVYTIRTPKRKKPLKIPRGLNILHNELAPTRDFDLLFNKEGHLIAIFPSITKILNDKALRWRVEINCFDFTAYYIQIPDLRDPESKSKWIEFAGKRKQNSILIKQYINPQNFSFTIKPVKNAKPYVYAELVTLPGTEITLPHMIEFHPDEILEQLHSDKIRGNLGIIFDTNNKNKRVIFPILPTSSRPLLFHVNPASSLLNIPFPS